MIIIPMAGMSSRFFKAGYSKPKYMLEAHGKTLFEHSVESFKQYFASHDFLFIVKDAFGTPSFVAEQAEKMGIKSAHIIILKEDTRGQAETVTLGLQQLEAQGVNHQDSITIFNIDTFRPNFIFPEVSNIGTGYLEVFKGEGENWSFAKPKENYSNLVIETAEKRAISDLCSTGLYHFNKKQDYLDAYNAYLSKPKEEWEKGELYIAPLYNHLIQNGLAVHYHLISRDDVIFCGVPDEYTDFLNKAYS